MRFFRVIYFIFFLLSGLYFWGQTTSFKNNSVLATGNWYKIATTETGIYRINRTFLSNMGIQVANLDPRKIQLYGNGGKMIPERNSDFRYDDLEENAIQVIGEADGVFDNSDYILFYATGTTEWKKTNSANGLKYAATKSLYSDTSYYYLTVGSVNGKRVQTQPSANVTPNISSNTYDYYNYHETDQSNLAKSGRTFYGEFFDITTSYTFRWNDGDFIINDSITAEVTLAYAGKQVGTFQINGNGLNHSFTTSAIPNLGGQYAEYAKDATGIRSVKNTNDKSIDITISKLTQNSVAWLNKLTVNARRKLSVNSKQFCFRDYKTVLSGNMCNYSVANPFNAVVSLWNVTNPLNPFIQAFNASGNQISFVASADVLNEYCIAPSTDFYSPTFYGKIANQNLHNIQQADYVVVTHPLFIKEAQELAVFHQQQEGLSYAVATTEQIYNEFGSGQPDISAIRDFIRMLYSRNLASGKQVKYVLLIGDGSYNNRSRDLVNNSNFIPTYQSVNSLDPLGSTATDDFYGLMGNNEGAGAAEGIGKIAIGIGRLVCRTTTEAQAMVKKIKNYYRKDENFQLSNADNYTKQSEVMGDWRNWIVLVADDEDGSLHMRQADDLSAVIQTMSNTYNFNKIFIDAYQRYSTPGGMRYPDAAEDLKRQIKKGVLIFNYTGHGGEVGLTAERMVDIPMINDMDNFDKLPLFITATCEFSRHDDPARTSAGELCLLNPKGGAIALMTTSRVTFSHSNFELNKVLFNNLFTKLPNGKYPTLGEAVMKTKAAFDQRYEYANFHLLGDPALTLAYPEEKVITSNINGTAVTSNSSDTLTALSKITVSGFVADNNGNKLSNFNGIVYPTVFDKEQDVVCLLNSEKSSVSSSDPVPFRFNLQKNILYRGKAEVKNGDFSFTFLVPKDISYVPGRGKISYYASNGTTDASGFYNKLQVGGESRHSVTDNEGPQVNLFLNDKSFANGGLTNETPVLYADIVDSSGINTVGTGIGHDISVILDQDSKPIILNDYYEAKLNSYQSGRVRFPFSELSEGNHQLSFKVWDIQNNSTTVTSDFIVAKTAELALNRVLNYPNPFTTRTQFMFQHNQACNAMKVTIQIFTVSGKAVKTIQTLATCSSDLKPEAIDWDGRDDFGDKLARGVYIYKLSILNMQNKKAEKIEKLVILN
ncbi:MAG: type IX secretion system sortase PorU [Bacteroidetes bacterium]|nr:type IX secretion system sortase PorU [Bacteroidota bacterium]